MNERDHQGRNSVRTLVDVAAYAEVSVSTAGRVLRNASYPVSKELRARVLKAAEVVGYVPNLLARSLKGAQPTYIGLIVGNMQEPFFGGIAEAVTDEARALPGIAIVANMQRDPKLELDLCGQLWEHRVRGLILAGGSYDQLEYFNPLQNLLSRMMAAGVVVTSLAERRLDVPTFAADNKKIGHLLALPLLKQGHTEIGLVFGSPKSIAAQQRVLGIRKALKGTRARVHLVNSDFELGSAGSVAGKLLERYPGITALICGGDTLAAGVAHFLLEKGYAIPDTYSVVGIGDTVYSRLITPSLSTVDTNVAGCARAAVRYIAERLEGAEWNAPPLFRACATYIERESTARPRTQRVSVADGICGADAPRDE